MGKANKEIRAFILAIPDSKLEALPGTPGTISTDGNFRLDMQGMTSSKPPEYNLQVQVNKGTTISTLKKYAPRTVAGPVLVPSNDPWTADQIKSALLASMKF